MSRYFPFPFYTDTESRTLGGSVEDENAAKHGSTG
jgi:hypothetical protein